MQAHRHPSYPRSVHSWAITPELVRACRVEYERGKKRRFIRQRCFNRFRVLELDQLRGLPRADGEIRCSGVYFLWRGPKLIYIGKTQNEIHWRLVFHRNSGKPFTHATYEAMEGSCARWCETDYIKRYWPPFNRIA